MCGSNIIFSLILQVATGLGRADLIALRLVTSIPSITHHFNRENEAALSFGGDIGWSTRVFLPTDRSNDKESEIQ